MPEVLLVVEDDPDMRELIKVTLAGDARLTVVGESTRAEEALAEARARRPDLIVLDHFIEGDVMGLELAPQLKAVAPESKILLFTSHDLAAEVAAEPAIDEYLRKRDLHRLLSTTLALLGLAGPAATR